MSKEEKYVFLPLPFLATPIEDARPFGRELRLPLSENELLKDCPISTDIYTPILSYGEYGKGVPSICLLVKSENDPKTLKNNTTVSVVAQKVSSVGYFPVIYGAKRFFDDSCDDETRERLIGEMKEGIFGDFFYCYLEVDDESASANGKKMVSELLKIEGYDYFVSKKDASGSEMVRWDRINKSCSIWSKGHLNGYKNCTFDIAHYSDEI